MNEERYKKIISQRNSTIYFLNKALDAANHSITDLEYDITQLNESADRLRKLVTTSGECDCLADWDSCGTDPATGDKLKRCNDCGGISVR